MRFDFTFCAGVGSRLGKGAIRKQSIEVGEEQSERVNLSSTGWRVGCGSFLRSSVSSIYDFFLLFRRAYTRYYLTI